MIDFVLARLLLVFKLPWLPPPDQYAFIYLADSMLYIFQNEYVLKISVANMQLLKYWAV